MAFVSVAVVTGVGVAQQSEDDGQVGEFAVSDFQAPSQANPGSGITATATVRNTGNASGMASVQYRISNRLVAERDIQLEPGESVTLSLRGTVPALSSGTHSHGVFIEGTGEGQSSVVVLGPRPASFSVVSIEPSAMEGTAGSSVSVTATVRNNGEERGFREIQYRIKGKEIASEVVTVEPDENETVTLRGTVPDRAVGRHVQGVYLGSGNNGMITTFRITSTRASFEVRGLRAPSSASGGDTVDARAVVINTGGTRGTQSVEYRIDGETVATDEVTLSPGERTNARFQGTVPERSRGTYQQGVFLGSSEFGVSSDIALRPSEAAKFTVYDLSAPSLLDLDGDGAVTATATVENAGEIAGSTRVEYRANDTVYDSTEVELGSGESTTVEFDADASDLGVGVYEQGVFVGDTDRGHTSSLRVASQPTVTVTAFRAPLTKTMNTSVSVRATIHNSNDQPETRTVEYRVGEAVVASEEVSLAGGTSRRVSLRGTVPFVEAGTYQHGVFIEDVGLTKSIRIRQPPEVVSDSDGDGDGAGGGDGDGGSGSADDGTTEPADEGDNGEGLPGFTAVAGVVALLTVAVVSRLRKRE